MHLYCIILEAFCNGKIYTFGFLAFQTFGSALYIVLFVVISAYIIVCYQYILTVELTFRPRFQ